MDPRRPNGGGGAARLFRLIERCHTEEASAWEAFVSWVECRGRRVLGAFGSLSRVDREDIVADALLRLLEAIRCRRIVGTNDLEIDSYVCTTIKNHARNTLRRRRRAKHVQEAIGDDPTASAEENPELRPDQRLMAAEGLALAERLLAELTPADRYIVRAKTERRPTRLIQATLARPPFNVVMGPGAIDTRFHRLQRRLQHRAVQGRRHRATRRGASTSENGAHSVSKVRSSHASYG
jgi:RNA polymerase sigma factor (sigma-70 family)